MPFTLTQEALQAWIATEAKSQVSGVTIVMRKGKDGPRSRGIGFVQVPNAQKDAVLALTGKDLEGRPVDVQVAKVQVAGGGERAPREKKEKAPAAPRPPREANADGEAPAPRRRNRARKSAAAAGGAAPAAAASSAASSEPRAAPKSKRQSTIPDADHTLLSVHAQQKHCGF